MTPVPSGDASSTTSSVRARQRVEDRSRDAGQVRPPRRTWAARPTCQRSAAPRAGRRRARGRSSVEVQSIRVRRPVRDPSSAASRGSLQGHLAQPLRLGPPPSTSVAVTVTMTLPSPPPREHEEAHLEVGSASRRVTFLRGRSSMPGCLTVSVGLPSSGSALVRMQRDRLAASDRPVARLEDERRDEDIDVVRVRPLRPGDARPTRVDRRAPRTRPRRSCRPRPTSRWPALEAHAVEAGADDRAARVDGRRS